MAVLLNGSSGPSGNPVTSSVGITDSRQWPSRVPGPYSGCSPPAPRRLGAERSVGAAGGGRSAESLAGELGGPTPFDLRKDGQAPLFVSVPVHGNEVSSWNAVRRLAPQLAENSTPVFVGNVEAARANARALPGRMDFNRVWEGGDSPEAAVASAVTAGLRLVIDIHNNTGRNPPYVVVSRTDRRTLAAAGAFSRRVPLATQPHGFQTRRFARFRTALMIEVGTPDDPASTNRAPAPAGDPVTPDVFETRRG